jgi:steroid delta-isomerase-like uncharacterized protein
MSEVWTKGRLDLVDELIDPGCLSHDPVSGKSRGPEAIKAEVGEYRKAFPDLRFDVEELIVSGDRVVTKWTATGTHRGPILGVPPTGKTFVIHGMSIDRLTNGKITEHSGQWDTLKFFQNLGLVGTSGKGAGRAGQEARPR